jgi:uncharacterized protein (TIGR00369 family)
MEAFTPRQDDYENAVRDMFDSIPFYRTLGITLDTIEPGFIIVRMPKTESVSQQNGFFHAGALTALADAAGGTAAATLLAEGENILSVNFGVSLLRPARADRLRAEGRVIKAGRRLFVAEAEIFADSTSDLLVKATITLAVA